MTRLFPVLLFFAACADTLPESDCPPVCLCTEEGCPPGVCGFLFSLSETCAALEPQVEIYAAGCLEVRDLTADQPVVPCGTIQEFQSGWLVARGASFQWGPAEFECPGMGGLFPIALDCRTTSEAEQVEPAPLSEPAR